jgi:ankyrin repeat protein/tetratricopeptide (TPR) repeat protein
LPTRAREIQKLTMSVPATRSSNLRAFLFLGMILCLLSSSAIHAAPVFSEEKVVGLLAAGDQNQAEAEVVKCIREGDRSPRAIFWAAVLARARFNLEASFPLLVHLLATQPESLEGRASGFILGIDTAKDSRTELFYYNALIAQTALEPNSIPLNWLVGIMARAIAGEGEQDGLTSETRKRILATGVASYSRMLSVLGVDEGPFTVHQTLANLLDELEDFEQAETHRKITLKKWRTPVSLHASGWTLFEMFRPEEALSQVNEAISLGGQAEKYYHLKGSILRQLDRLPEAIEAWSHAAEYAQKSKAYYWDQMSKDFLLLGKPAEAKFYSAKALADYPHAEAYEILDARLAALVGEPDGPQRVANADSFDFNGDVVLKKPEEKNFQTDASLYAAASTGDLTALRAALPSSDINALGGKYNQTALMVAAQSGFTHIIEELLKHGAALDIVDLNGDTALHYASQFRQVPALRLLLAAGAKTDIQDKWKQTPLTMAACNKDMVSFRELLPKSRIDQATPHGGTALHYACGYGHLPMIRELIAAGADVNSTARGQKRTPLMSACDEWPHPYIVGPLIKAGASINLQDVNGKTALAHAVDPLLNRGLVEMLLENGANPTIADKNGVTPIRAARCLGFEDVARLMESVAGAPEPFVFPKFEPPGSDATTEDQRAAAYVLPILLAQGHPLGRVGSPLNEKQAARKELRRMFGIQNKDELASEIEALESFRPANKPVAAPLPEGMTFDRLMAIADNSAEKIFQKRYPQTSDESAWIHAHLIYLSDLGLAADYLPREKADTILKNSTQYIAKNFAGWSTFLDSFLMGATRHNSWESERYGHITKLLAVNAPDWPNPKD